MECALKAAAAVLTLVVLPALAQSPEPAPRDPAPSDPASFTLPAIEGYELVKKLGDGGQGVVYLARHQGSGELVALKMLLAQVAVQQRARAQFQREIDNLQSLDHPNVVGFREAGQVGAAFFFTSEYCAGGSVDDLVHREGPLRWIGRCRWWCRPSTGWPTRTPWRCPAGRSVWHRQVI